MSKVIYTKTEYKEHDWIRDKDGSIDTFAMSVGFCNGPVCKRCHYSFCEHCNSHGYEDTNCTVTSWKCPKCNTELGLTRDNFCRHCGVQLEWESEYK